MYLFEMNLLMIKDDVVYFEEFSTKNGGNHIEEFDSIF